VHHGCGEAIWGGGGVEEKEERGEGVAHSVERGREVRAEEWEEEMCRESEEWGQECRAEAGRRPSGARFSRPRLWASGTWTRGRRTV
jgi:hypothetical protein